MPKFFTFGVDVPGEGPCAMTVQEDNEPAARRLLGQILGRTYLPRDLNEIRLLDVREGT